MGIDIRGYVEIRSPITGVWSSVVEIRPIVDRNYDAFGCLFGVKNYARFDPIAAQRGLPDDLSEGVRAIAEHYRPLTGCFLDPTWVSWAELKAVNWDERAAGTDLRIHAFERDERGEWVFRDKSEWRRPPRAEALPLPERGSHLSAVLEEVAVPRGLPEGQEWEADGILYRSVRLRRSDAVGDDWRLVFGFMEALAGHFSADGVRLVAWFDA